MTRQFIAPLVLFTPIFALSFCLHTAEASVAPQGLDTGALRASSQRLDLMALTESPDQQDQATGSNTRTPARPALITSDRKDVNSSAPLGAVSIKPNEPTDVDGVAPIGGSAANPNVQSGSPRSYGKSEDSFVWPQNSAPDFPIRLAAFSPLLAPSIQYLIPSEPYDWGRLRGSDDILVLRRANHDFA